MKILSGVVLPFANLFTVCSHRRLLIFIYTSAFALLPYHTSGGFWKTTILSEESEKEADEVLALLWKYFVNRGPWITLWDLCSSLSTEFQKKWESLDNLWTLVLFLISYKLRPKKKDSNTNQVPWNILFWDNLSILKIILHSNFHGYHHRTSPIWTSSQFAFSLAQTLLSSFSEWKQV